MERNKKQILTENGITPLQEMVASRLALGHSITDVAKDTKNLARSTIYAWLRDRKFVAYYKSLLAEVRQEVRGSLSAMAGEATRTLQELMANGGEQAKLKAATYIIDRLSDDEKRVSKSKNDGCKKG